MGMSGNDWPPQRKPWNQPNCQYLLWPKLKCLHFGIPKQKVNHFLFSDVQVVGVKGVKGVWCNRCLFFCIRDTWCYREYVGCKGKASGPAPLCSKNRSATWPWSSNFPWVAGTFRPAAKKVAWLLLEWAGFVATLLLSEVDVFSFTTKNPDSSWNSHLLSSSVL